MTYQWVRPEKLVLNCKSDDRQWPVPATGDHAVIFPEKTSEKISGKYVGNAFKSSFRELIPRYDDKVIKGIVKCQCISVQKDTERDNAQVTIGSGFSINDGNSEYLFFL